MTAAPIDTEISREIDSEISSEIDGEIDREICREMPARPSLHDYDRNPQPSQRQPSHRPHPQS